jgi:membrane dipeptidase
MEAFEEPKKIFKMSSEEEQRAEDLHKKAIFIDALGGEPLYPQNFQILMKSGLSALRTHSINLATDKNFIPRTFSDTVISISNLFDHCDKYSDMYIIALSVEDIKKAKDTGKIAIILGTQWADFLKGVEDLKLLSVLYRLGLRILQIAYSERNLIGDGWNERGNCGLSNYGIKVVDEMNKLGILIDLAHVGDATTMDTIEFSNQPVIFSHSTCRSISHHPRGKSDEAIKAMAEKGGVIGIVAKNHYLTYQTGKNYIRYDINKYLDHIDYVVNIVGIDHVGIGLDIYYPIIRTKEEFEDLVKRKNSPFNPYNVEMNYQKLQVEGLDCIEDYPNITRGLVIRGYSDQEIIKILGGNFLRVYENVWKK